MISNKLMRLIGLTTCLAVIVKGMDPEASGKHMENNYYSHQPDKKTKQKKALAKAIAGWSNKPSAQGSPPSGKWAEIEAGLAKAKALARQQQQTNTSGSPSSNDSSSDGSRSPSPRRFRGSQPSQPRGKHSPITFRDGNTTVIANIVLTNGQHSNRTFTGVNSVVSFNAFAGQQAKAETEVERAERKEREAKAAKEREAKAAKEREAKRVEFNAQRDAWIAKTVAEREAKERRQRKELEAKEAEAKKAEAEAAERKKQEKRCVIM